MTTGCPPGHPPPLSKLSLGGRTDQAWESLLGMEKWKTGLSRSQTFLSVALMAQTTLFHTIRVFAEPSLKFKSPRVSEAFSQPQERKEAPISGRGTIYHLLSDNMPWWGNARFPGNHSAKECRTDSLVSPPTPPSQGQKGT